MYALNRTRLAASSNDVAKTQQKQMRSRRLDELRWLNANGNLCLQPSEATCSPKCQLEIIWTTLLLVEQRALIVLWRRHLCQLTTFHARHAYERSSTFSSLMPDTNERVAWFPLSSDSSSSFFFVPLSASLSRTTVICLSFLSLSRFSDEESIELALEIFPLRLQSIYVRVHSAIGDRSCSATLNLMPNRLELRDRRACVSSISRE